jgi:hypothetical protein
VFYYNKNVYVVVSFLEAYFSGCFITSITTPINLKNNDPINIIIKIAIISAIRNPISFWTGIQIIIY